MHICKISKDFTAKKCCCIGNVDFVEGILQWCSWQASFKQKFVFPLILCKTVKSTYLNIKWLPLHTVLHVLWIHLSMMLLTSCFSISWLLICLLAPSDLQSTKNFMMNFWKTWNFSILHSLLWKWSFSDAIDEQFQPTLIQIIVIPLITFTAV